MSNYFAEKILFDVLTFFFTFFDMLESFFVSFRQNLSPREIDIERLSPVLLRGIRERDFAQMENDKL